MEKYKKLNDDNYAFCKWDDGDFEKEMKILKERRKEILENKK